MDLENLCRWILAGLGIGIGMPSPASAQEANSLLQLPPPIVEFLQESWDKDGLHQLDVGKDGHVDYVLKVLPKIVQGLRNMSPLRKGMDLSAYEKEFAEKGHSH